MSECCTKSWNDFKAKQAKAWNDYEKMLNKKCGNGYNYQMPDPENYEHVHKYIYQIPDPKNYEHVHKKNPTKDSS